MPVIVNRRYPFYQQPEAGEFRLNKNSSQARGLIGWWPLNDNNTHMVRDYSIHQNDGYVHGATPSTMPGYGLGYKFVESSQQYIEIPERNWIYNMPNRFTLSAWIVHDDTAAERYEAIVSKRDGLTYNWQMRMDTTNISILTGVGGSAKTNSNIQGIAANIAVTLGWKRINQVRLYAQGRDFYAHNGHAVSANNINVMIGGSFGDHNFNGHIADVRVYNRAFSSSEVADLYRNRWQLFERMPARRFIFVPDEVTPSVSAVSPYYRWRRRYA